MGALAGIEDFFARCGQVTDRQIELCQREFMLQC
jgi:hypothetical protein